MFKPKIRFFAENTDFNLKNKTILRNWICKIVQNESFELVDLNYIFCDDAYLISMNEQFLQHDTLTDVITFDNSEESSKIYGEIYISIDRIRENASIFKTEFVTELKRVMAHGLLHLCGYRDKTLAEKSLMRNKEAEALELFKTI
jgi:probable rRNA maturation factor